MSSANGTYQSIERRLASGELKPSGKGFEFMKIGEANAEIVRLRGELSKVQNRVNELEAVPSNIAEITKSAESLLQENRELNRRLEAASKQTTTAPTPAPAPAPIPKLFGLARVQAVIKSSITKGK